MPDGSDIDDLEVVRAANPAFGTRINEEFLETERANMTDEEYARERLGIFPDEDAAPQWLTVSEADWVACATGESEEKSKEEGWFVGPVSLAIEMPPRQGTAEPYVWIMAAGQCREGTIGVDVKVHGPGSAWVPDMVSAMTADQGHPVHRVVIDSRSPAGSLIAGLTAAGVEVTEPPTEQVIKATGQLVDSIVAHGLKHRNRPELTKAASVAELRKVGEASVLDRWANPDAMPLIGASLARWGCLQPAEVKKKRTGVVT